MFVAICLASLHKTNKKKYIKALYSWTVKHIDTDNHDIIVDGQDHIRLSNQCSNTDAKELQLMVQVLATRLVISKITPNGIARLFLVT